MNLVHMQTSVLTASTGLLSACVLLLIASAAASEAADPFPARPYRSVAELSDDLKTVRDRWLDLNTLRTADPELASTGDAVEGITRNAARLRCHWTTRAEPPRSGRRPSRGGER